MNAENDKPTVPVQGDKQKPIIPAPGIPPTDCFGPCCAEHYTLRAVTSLVKAGRKLERQAMELALKKIRTTAQGKPEQLELVIGLDAILAKLKTGDFTGCKL